MKYLATLSVLLTFNALASIASPDGIYGPDNRKDVYEATSDQQYFAKSVAAMIHKDFIETNYVNSKKVLTLKTARTLAAKLVEEYNVNVCPGTKFVGQPGHADCTGILISSNVILTAGHCINSEEDCAKYFWVFDYKTDSRGKVNHNLFNDDVVSCKRVISRDMNPTTGLDYALVELDRKITNRTAMNYRMTGMVDSTATLFTIGTPSNLPLKVATDGTIRENSIPDFFITNLDTFGGNSGSPVFEDKNYGVEGILVRGDTDFVIDKSRNCVTENKCANDGCKGEHVTRTAAIPEIRLLGEGFKLIWGKATVNELETALPSNAWIDFPNPVGATLLFAAVETSRIDIINFLIDKGANPNAQDVNGFSAIFSNLNAANPSIIKALINRGAKLELRNNAGETPLLYAAREGKFEAVKMLLKLGAYSRASDHKGKMAVSYFQNKPEQLNELREMGLYDPDYFPTTATNKFDLIRKIFALGTQPLVNELNSRSFIGRCFKSNSPDTPEGAVLVSNRKDDITKAKVLLAGKNPVTWFDSTPYDKLLKSISKRDLYEFNYSGDDLIFDDSAGGMNHLRRHKKYLVLEYVKQADTVMRCYFFYENGLPHL